MQKTACSTDNCTDVDLEEFWQICQLQEDQVYIYSKVHILLDSVHPGAFRC